MAGMGDDLTNFLGQGDGYSFVRVDLEYPLARTGLDAGVAPGSLDLPGAFDQVFGVARGNRAGVIGAAVEHHDNLVGEGQPVEAGDELGRFVVCHYQNGEPGRRHAVAP